ncbi:helix-turn-helix domain-containing protein [Actinomadura opuntiae]|uniref:helix-turn-helix domain-containing protein n=1 Tax=Actinomadura sp. OS1-43 TaxID=604315 RepID=UPI004064B687
MVVAQDGQLRQLIGELADFPAVARVADLAIRAAVSAPTEGRVLYAGLRALEVPEEPVTRLWHATTLLREYRGDGHNAALVRSAGCGRAGCRRRRRAISTGSRTRRPGMSGC